MCRIFRTAWYPVRIRWQIPHSADGENVNRPLQNVDVYARESGCHHFRVTNPLAACSYTHTSINTGNGFGWWSPKIRLISENTERNYRVVRVASAFCPTDATPMNVIRPNNMCGAISAVETTRHGSSSRYRRPTITITNRATRLWMMMQLAVRCIGWIAHERIRMCVTHQADG